MEDIARRLGSLTNAWIAGIVAVATLVVLLLTVGDTGLTWDEPVYMEASESYVQWIEELFTHPITALQSQAIDQYWQINSEHPPFDKVWSGIFWMATRPFFDDITAHRIGNLILSAVLTGLLYYLVAENYGKAAGLGAFAALLSMPRFFFHTHVAALDVPTTTTIFIACCVYWLTRDKPAVKWSLVAGVAFGIAASTKINGLVEVPFMLLMWSLIFKREITNFVRILVMTISGIVLWILAWPWLYNGLVSRMIAYIQFLTVNHYKPPQWYLGQFYLPLPWHYPFVISVAVIPLAITILAMAGFICVLLRRGKDKLGWLFIFFAGFPILIVVFNLIDAFDEERLLMPAFPFIAALAGIGFGRLIQFAKEKSRTISQGLLPGAAIAAITVICFLPQVISASKIYPHLLSYYSEAVGGISGARKLGMESTYWAESYQASLGYLNAHAPQGSTVWVEAMNVMRYYQKVGRLRSDIRVASAQGNLSVIQGVQGYIMPITAADYAVIEFRQSGFDSDTLGRIGAHSPVLIIEYDNVRVMGIYPK